MTTIKHIHSSSLYSRSAESLNAAAKKYNADADLVTYTEVQAEFRETAVRKAGGKDWGFVSGDVTYSNDCAIAFKKDRFKVLYKENFKSTNTFFYNVSGRKRDPQYATIAVLEDKLEGKNLVVLVIHLASSVESDMAKGGEFATRRTINWFDSFRKSKRRANKLKKKYKAGAVLFIADFNIDFKKRWCRNLVKTLAPAYTLTWKNVNIKGGTHRNRIIDATLVRGKMKVRNSARLYADDASSDHRPYIETLVWS